MAAALQHCFSQARALSPSGLSMVVWSLASLRFAPPQGWVGKALVATHARMGGFTAQELSMLATSLARLEVRPPLSWLQAFEGAAEARMASFGPQALANMLWALATLHHKPSDAWLQRYSAQLQPAVARFTPAQVRGPQGRCRCQCARLPWQLGLRCLLACRTDSFEPLLLLIPLLPSHQPACRPALLTPWRRSPPAAGHDDVGARPPGGASPPVAVAGAAAARGRDQHGLLQPHAAHDAASQARAEEAQGSSW
jgi:hypothetical protein